MYEFSPGEFDSIESDPEYWYEHGYRVGIVMTIIDMDKTIEKIELKKDNINSVHFRKL